MGRHRIYLDMKHSLWKLSLVTVIAFFWVVPGGVQSQSFTIATYNISNASTGWNASNIQSRLSNVSSITLNTTSDVSVLVETCPMGTYSLADSQTCSACPPGKYSTTPLASSSSVCVSCESGRYSTTLGASSSATCLACPNNTYFAGTGGVNISVCMACPVNSWSYEASKLLQSCICSPGYSGANGEFQILFFRLNPWIDAFFDNRRTMFGMQLISVVLVWASESMPHKLEFKPQVFQSKSVSLHAWLLRGYHHEHSALPNAVPGES